MKFYLGVTDTNWFNYLSSLYNPEERWEYRGGV
jgi:hypothetical protein